MFTQTAEDSEYSKEGENGVLSKNVSQEEKIQVLKKLLKEKDDQIIGLCQQIGSQSMSEEYLSARSTPLTSMIQEDKRSAICTRKQGEPLPTSKRVVSDDSEERAATEAPYVSRLRERLHKLTSQLEEAENRARRFELEYNELLRQLSNSMEKGQSTHENEGRPQVKSVASDRSSKEGTSSDKEHIIGALRNRVKELEKAAAALAKTQQHSRSQSKQLLDLQDEAKVSYL